jgi:16S rRNA C1402 (ribose-2'-O) methylase RsmI
MRILVRENEKKKLQAIIAFSQSPERRKNALDDLADILKEIKAVADELAKLESE